MMHSRTSRTRIDSRLSSRHRTWTTGASLQCQRHPVNSDTQHTAITTAAVHQLTNTNAVHEYLHTHPHVLASLNCTLTTLSTTTTTTTSTTTTTLPTAHSTAYDVIHVQELTEGLINHVYKVTVQPQGNQSGPPTQQHVLVKYAPPYVKSSAGAVQLSQVRMDVEAQAMQLAHACCPAHVPRMIHYDSVNNIMIVQFLDSIKVLDGIHQWAATYPQLPRQLGRLLANIYSQTGHAALGPDAHAAQVHRFANSEIVLLNEQVVLTNPLDANNPSNQQPTCPQLKAAIAQFRTDPIVLVALSEVVNSYRCDKQALLHNDLHWANLLVGDGLLHCIDWEFASYGPIAFDLGSLLAVQLLAIITLTAALATGQGQPYTKKQIEWLWSSVVEVWVCFMDAYTSQVMDMATNNHHGGDGDEQQHTRTAASPSSAHDDLHGQQVQQLEQPGSAWESQEAGTVIGVTTCDNSVGAGMREGRGAELKDKVHYQDVVSFASFCLFRLTAGIHSYAGLSDLKSEVVQERCRRVAVMMAQMLLHRRAQGDVLDPRDVVRVGQEQLRDVVWQ